MVATLVDIDDTLSGTMTALLEYVNERASRHYRYEELNREFRERNEGEYYDLVQEALRAGNLQVFPLAGALAGVSRLHQAGHEVHIVSARPEDQHKWVRRWLQTYDFSPYITEIHPRPSSQKGSDFKRAVAKRIKPKAAFEDTYELARALAPVCPKTYLIDCPWNRADGLPGGVIRVPSFAAGVERFLSGDPPAPRA